MCLPSSWEGNLKRIYWSLLAEESFLLRLHTRVNGTRNVKFADCKTKNNELKEPENAAFSIVYAGVVTPAALRSYCHYWYHFPSYSKVVKVQMYWWFSLSYWTVAAVCEGVSCLLDVFLSGQYSTRPIGSVYTVLCSHLCPTESSHHDCLCGFCYLKPQGFETGCSSWADNRGLPVTSEDRSW